jgi:flagellar biosynthesis/type III secretory pathway protein FliH
MSMSSSNAAAVAPALEVESFVYQNTGSEGAPAAAQSLNEEAAAAKPKDDNVPRISEQELNKLMSEARAEGAREGERRALAIFEEELAKQRQKLMEALSAFDQERSQYYSKVEVELVHFSLAIAARILHREALVDRMVVAGLVKVTIEKLQQGTKVIAHVRPEEGESWRNYFHGNDHLEIREDSSLEPRACKLETELGTTDLGLDAQLKEIEQGFFDLLAQRPQPK